VKNFFSLIGELTKVQSEIQNNKERKNKGDQFDHFFWWLCDCKGHCLFEK
jgi:hypothetical protein